MAYDAELIPFTFSNLDSYILECRANPLLVVDNGAVRVAGLGDIEVTPAMIAAGVQALLFVRNEYGSEAMFDNETTVRIFRAMLAASTT